MSTKMGCIWCCERDYGWDTVFDIEDAYEARERALVEESWAAQRRYLLAKFRYNEFSKAPLYDRNER